MKYRTRTYYTEVQKAVMWERWRQGWTLHQITHLFDRVHPSVQRILSRSGGIDPPRRMPAAYRASEADRAAWTRAIRLCKARGASALVQALPRATAAYIRYGPAAVRGSQS
jgi:hypothetical protein